MFDVLAIDDVGSTNILVLLLLLLTLRLLLILGVMGNFLWHAP